MERPVTADDRVDQIRADLGVDALGRPLNPDTNLPYPSASAAQEQLADELYARLIDARDEGTLNRDLIRDALVEVAVRQHGRTLRAVLGELSEQADGLDADARREVEQSVGATLDPAGLREAYRLSAAASILRRVVLGGWRA